MNGLHGVQERGMTGRKEWLEDWQVDPYRGNFPGPVPVGLVQADRYSSLSFYLNYFARLPAPVSLMQLGVYRHLLSSFFAHVQRWGFRRRPRYRHSPTPSHVRGYLPGFLSQHSVSLDRPARGLVERAEAFVTAGA